MGSDCRRVLLGVGAETARELYGPVQAHAGLSVVGIVHDGRAVLDSVVRVKPEVLAMDLVLPELDGLAVLECLGTSLLDDRPKVIALSSLSQERVIAPVSAASADYFVLKPRRPELVLERILQLTAVRPAIPKAVPMPESPPVGQNHRDHVSHFLVEIGVPANLKGFRYLQQAIHLVTIRVELLGAVTKELYPSVARTYDTTPSRVERAIRHAIEVAWARGDAACLKSVFGNTVNRERGKPTNSQFIALLSDRLRPSQVLEDHGASTR